MISVYRWNASNKAGEWCDIGKLEAQPDELRTYPGVLWIDLDRPTEEEERLVLQQLYPVHSLTLEDVTRLRREPDEPHLPKVEEFPDYLFVVVNPLAPDVLTAVQKGKAPSRLTAKRATTQLTAVLTHNVLITHHAEDVAAVSQLRTFLSKHEAQADRGPDYLFHIILDAMVDQYAPVLDLLDAGLDEVETQVFTRPTQRLLVRLLQLKRDIVHLRKALVHEREILARLARGEFELIDAREMVYYRNVYDHLVRFTELLEASREMVTDLMETHLSAASNKLNEIMKVLTMISTVVLPMTLIAGVYGMNFEHNVWPSFGSSWGFPFAIVAMVLTGVAAAWFFRRQKWI